MATLRPRLAQEASPPTAEAIQDLAGLWISANSPEFAAKLLDADPPNGDRALSTITDSEYEPRRRELYTAWKEAEQAAQDAAGAAGEAGQALRRVELG